MFLFEIPSWFAYVLEKTIAVYTGEVLNGLLIYAYRYYRSLIRNLNYRYVLRCVAYDYNCSLQPFKCVFRLKCAEASAHRIEYPSHIVIDSTKAINNV